MGTHLYEIETGFAEDEWALGPPWDAVGELEPGAFCQGERLGIAGELTIPSRPGRPLELTLSYGVPVATERIASLLGELAAADLERFPARVESMPGTYEVLNVISMIDCIDRERTVGQLLIPGEGWKTGTLSSLATTFVGDPEPDLDESAGYNMEGLSYAIDELRLDTTGIEGARIFRVKGWRDLPVVTEDIKAALDEEGVTGVHYRLVS